MGEARDFLFDDLFKGVIDAFSRHCLLNGVDQLGFLLGGADAIAAFEAQHPIELDTTR